jgi:plasmid stabilization system protein ParE
MARAEWTDLAESELKEILYYITVKEARPHVAVQVAERTLERCKLYADNPFAGEVLPGFGGNYRSFTVQRWVVIYQPHDEGIEVVGIVDASRDFDKYFRDR